MNHTGVNAQAVSANRLTEKNWLEWGRTLTAVFAMH